MKKWLIFYIILIIALTFIIKSVDRIYVITDTKLSKHKEILLKDNPNISDDDVKKSLDSKFFLEAFKRSFFISSGIIAFAFIMACLRNSFISEFFHFR